MTTPVFMEKDEIEAQMGFVMPKEVAVAGTPQPTGEGVAIRKRAGGRFAVIRFSGRLSEKLAKENEAKLREWMKTKNLIAAETKPDTPEFDQRRIRLLRSTLHTRPTASQRSPDPVAIRMSTDFANPESHRRCLLRRRVPTMRPRDQTAPLARL